MAKTDPKSQVSGSSGSSDFCEAEPSVAPLHTQQRLCMVGREIREVSWDEMETITCKLMPFLAR